MEYYTRHLVSELEPAFRLGTHWYKERLGSQEGPFNTTAGTYGNNFPFSLKGTYDHLFK